MKTYSSLSPLCVSVRYAQGLWSISHSHENRRQNQISQVINHHIQCMITHTHSRPHNQMLSHRFNGHFPGRARSAGTRMSPFCILLEWLRWCWQLQPWCAKLQSNHHHQQTNTRCTHTRLQSIDIAWDWSWDVRQSLIGMEGICGHARYCENHHQKYHKNRPGVMANDTSCRQ